MDLIKDLLMDLIVDLLVDLLVGTEGSNPCQFVDVKTLESNTGLDGYWWIY